MRPAYRHSLEAMTPVQRLIEALHLALIEPSSARSEEVSEIADWLASGLSDAEVECAKSIALARWTAGAAP